MKLHLLVAVLFFPLWSSSTFAAWREASSDHFVIYADDSESDLRNFSEKLERYRKAMAFIFPSKGIKPSPSNRVTVYVVGSESQVKKLYGDAKAAKYIGGFYVPYAGGSLAIIPSINSSRRGEPTMSELTLLHEYAHHFLFESANYMIPRWFGEGFAEYFSATKFDKDGAVGLGLPANSRVYDFIYASRVSLEELFDTKAYAARTSERYNNFYARSWSLFHYLYSDEGRRRLMLDYLNRLNNGEGELASAIAAFGDLDTLDETLKDYIRQPKLKYYRVPPEATVPGEIHIRELNKAEAAIMPVRIRSKAGVDEQEAAEVVVDARKVAAQYPDEPEVLAELAEAEYDAGNDTAAIAAADQALAHNPGQINAMVQKGYALMRIAKSQGGAEKWSALREHFIALNKIENDHPIALIYYYLYFTEQGAEPTETAVRGLEWALELSPFDMRLRLMAAKQQMAEKRFADVIRTLKPMAYNTHLEEGNPALKMLEEAKQALAASAARDPYPQNEVIP